MGAKDGRREYRQDQSGMRCPKCNSGYSRVLYTRKEFNGGLRRRRECRHCFARFTTREK